MEIQVTRLAAQPPADASPVARPPASPADRVVPPSDPKRVDTVEITQADENRPPSPAIEVLQQRRRAITPSGIRLQVDEAVDRVIAQVFNENNEIIKQIPPEEAVRAFARFREVTGLIFDLEI